MTHCECVNCYSIPGGYPQPALLSSWMARVSHHCMCRQYDLTNMYTT
jgi:hypothetical protein